MESKRISLVALFVSAALLVLPACADVLKTRREDLLSSGRHALQFRNPLPALRGCEGLDCVKRYVNFVDHGFAWNQLREVQTGAIAGRFDAAQAPTSQCRWTMYALNMTSQTWHTEETGRERWTHNLLIFVPDHLNEEKNADRSLPHNGWAVLGINVNPEAMLQMSCSTGVITVSLTNVPNAGLDFSNDPRGVLQEENMKAWSWAQFAAHPDHPEWVVELPSAKATVRAMDAVTAFSRKLGLWTVPHRWIVTGASKRGMACYHTAAVDRRVKAIIPLVIALNRDGYSTELFHNLGGITDGNIIYDDEGVNMWFNKKGVERRVDKVIDPYYWIDVFTMPKLILNVGRDAYFIPDMTKHYWPQLPEPKSFFIFGPSAHTGDYIPKFLEAASAFISGQVLNVNTPKISWTIDEGTGAIRAHQDSNHTPRSVRSWQAWTSNARLRDFRRAGWTRGTRELAARHRTWTLEPRPASESFGRWNALYIEFEYAPACPACAPWRLTTEVSIWPRTHPFQHMDLQDYNKRLQ